MAIAGGDGNATGTATITITVTNINDNAPIVDDDTGVIAENTSTGTLVVTMSGSDADGDSISYVITAGNGDGVFSISGDQIIVGNTSNLDYETTSGYILIVSGSDGVYADTATITITITNVNDNAPVVEDDTAVVAENASTGTLVVTISGSDADGDSISYVITAGNGDGIFSISGDQIIVGDTSNLDYEVTT